MPRAADEVFIVPEEIFCSGVVKYYFQPVGLIVANCQEIAENAADLVSITYIEGQQKPLLTIREVLAANPEGKIGVVQQVQAKSRGW